jgi:hypothetical protein
MLATALDEQGRMWSRLTREYGDGYRSTRRSPIPLFIPIRRKFHGIAIEHDHEEFIFPEDFTYL